MRKDPFQRAAGAPELPPEPFRFVGYFVRHYRAWVVLMALCEAGQATCQILIPYSFKELIDAATKAGGGTFQAGSPAVHHAISLFGGLSLGILLFSRSSGAILATVGPALRRRVRHYLYHYLQYHSHRYFLGNFAGSLSNRIAEVSMGVNHALWSVVLDFWPVAITLSVSLGLLFKAHHSLGILLFGWAAIFIGVSYALALRCRTYAKEFAAARSTVSGKIVDAVTNIFNSKIFSRLGFERDYLYKYLSRELGTARKTFWFMEKMRWFQYVATLSLQVAIIVYALRLMDRGEITVGQFSMVASLALLIIADCRNLSRRFLEFFEVVGNISDGVGIMVRPHEVIDQAATQSFAVRKGEIRFENVDFAYSEGLPVFRGLNVTIRPGERVGLVGFSGSGKSTFVNLLLRFFDVQGGRILIDGQEVGKVAQDALREHISLIPQDPLLFHRTLRENIRYGQVDATDAEVEAAARKARAHEFIAKMPEGYESLVGERGVKLSGGQRQRIAIARAVLKNAPILVMDEATSSLDSVTEKAIQASLDELMRGRTVIVIAHRLSTIAHLDRIIVFDQGKVLESAPHQELLKHDGHYARMWAMQAGGFLPAEAPEEPVTAAGPREPGANA